MYVGPQRTHYTVPKRLLYHFSDHAKACLEDSFWEASANAIRLPDVNPDVFQWLLTWLYTGELKILRYYSQRWGLSKYRQLEHACRVLCRVHFLGERLLFDQRLLESGVQGELDTVIEEAENTRDFMPLTPEVIEEVLSDSAPVQYEGEMSWASCSLRPFVLGHLRTFRFCTTVKFMEYAACFEMDGAFAAELMTFMASEMKWAVERWEADVEEPVDIIEKQRQFAETEGFSQYVTTRPEKGQGVWLVLRYICTFSGCMAMDFRAYSQCFELDGGFAASIMDYMAQELLWIVEMWGWERGWPVDVAAEKDEEERIAQEESDRQHMLEKTLRRQGWS